MVGRGEGGIWLTGRDDADAAGRFLEDDGQDEARVDVRLGTDAQDCVPHFRQLLVAVIGDSELSAGDLHLGDVGLEPGITELAFFVLDTTSPALKELTCS